MSGPLVLGTLTWWEHIPGDEALMRLAQARFTDAGLGAEFYTAHPEQVAEWVQYRPSGSRSMLHLPREADVTNPDSHALIRSFAKTASGQFYGMNLHDSPRMAEYPAAAAAALRAMDAELARIPDCPLLFVEYACGLTPDEFARVFEQTRDLQHILCCIDVGHVGIRAIQRAYGDDAVCSLDPDGQELPWERIANAVKQALPTVLELIERIGALGRPLHLHLHDGHPLSTLSRYGVSDHLGFEQFLRGAARPDGVRLFGGMFGPNGLREIVNAARQVCSDEHLSMVIEVHPQEGCAPLGPHEHVFGHWRDHTQAERMNHWLDIILRNTYLLRSML